MKLDLLIEAVTTKVPAWATKFNSGSVQSNGKWYSVRKQVDINKFVKGALVAVEVEVNESKGKTYENITRVLNVQEAEITTNGTTTTSDAKNVTFTPSHTRDFDKEAKGKSRFGLYANALASPFLAANSTSVEDFKAKSDELVEYFMSKIFKD